MKNTITLTALLKLLSLTVFVVFVAASCGCDDEMSIKELKLCDVKVEAGSVECNENQSSFPKDVAFISATALVEAHEESTVLTYTFTRLADNMVLATGTSNFANAPDDVDDSCMARSGFSWSSTNGIWPTGQFEIKVEANNSGVSALSQTFTIE